MDDLDQLVAEDDLSLGGRNVLANLIGLFIGLRDGEATIAAL